MSDLGNLLFGMVSKALLSRAAMGKGQADLIRNAGGVLGQMEANRERLPWDERTRVFRDPMRRFPGDGMMF